MSEDNEVTNHQPEVCRIPGSVLCIRLGLKHVQPPERYDTYRIGIFEMTIHDSSWNFGWLSIKWAKTKIDSNIKLRIERLNHINITFDEFLCKMDAIAQELDA